MSGEESLLAVGEGVVNAFAFEKPPEVTRLRLQAYRLFLGKKHGLGVTM